MLDERFVSSHASMDCGNCRAQLPAYVRAEFSNQEFNADYARMALHIENCPDCEAAYYLEFRNQGLQYSVDELKSIGSAASATVMDQIYGSFTIPAASKVGWHERVLAYGCAWYDRSTDQLKQWEVRLVDLLAPSGATPSLAFAGLQSMGDDSGSPQFVQATLDDGQTEVAVTWLEQPALPAPPLLLVTVTQEDPFADLSDIRVTARWPDGERSALTDAEGKAYLEGLAGIEMRDLVVLLELP